MLLSMTDPTPAEPRTRHVVGCMTGTSLDGLDCALTRITGCGLGMAAQFLGLVSRPFNDQFRATLRRLAEGHAAPPIDYLRAARTLGVLHADAVAQLISECGHTIEPSRRVPAADTPRGRGGSDTQRPMHTKAPGAVPGAGAGAIDFIVAHGQTIWHAPQDTLSWQLFDPWPLVKHIGVPVCYDLRQADLIAGGQGAPITPIADWVMYRHHADAVVNLGGIANMTALATDPASITASDLCPCNLLLDGVVTRLYPEHHYDPDGRIARSGKVIEVLKMAVVTDVVGAIGDARTLGREQLPEAMLDHWVGTARQYQEPADIVATYTEAVAELLGIALAGRGRARRTDYAPRGLGDVSPPRRRGGEPRRHRQHDRAG